MYFLFLNIHRWLNIANITPHGPDDGSVETKHYCVDFSINLSFHLDYLVIYIYIYIYIYVCVYVHVLSIYICFYSFMYEWLYFYMCTLYIYIYIYIYIFIHIHTHMYWLLKDPLQTSTIIWLPLPELFFFFFFFFFSTWGQIYFYHSMSLKYFFRSRNYLNTYLSFFLLVQFSDPQEMQNKPNNSYSHKSTPASIW